jgi:lambda family phage portal protein
MIHLYHPDRVNQTRGVTWVHSVMIPAHMLNGYEESEAVAARVGASKMGWLVKKGDSVAGDLTADMKTPATMEAAPGTFEALPDGYEMQTWAPEHPTGQFAAFIKQMIRKIATGFDVFSNVLANDAEGVSYSSMRSFALIEHDDWRAIQQDFIDAWRRPMYRAWIETALLAGALALPSRDPRRYQAVKHSARGWAWIDPLKEVTAAKIAIAEGLTSRTRVLAEKGDDFETIMNEQAHEAEVAAAKGLKIESAGSLKIVMNIDDDDDTDGGKAGGENGDRAGELAAEAVLRDRQGIAVK